LHQAKLLSHDLGKEDHEDSDDLLNLTIAKVKKNRGFLILFAGCPFDYPLNPYVALSLVGGARPGHGF
jgi:hypothetical protein